MVVLTWNRSSSSVHWRMFRKIQKDHLSCQPLGAGYVLFRKILRPGSRNRNTSKEDKRAKSVAFKCVFCQMRLFLRHCNGPTKTVEDLFRSERRMTCLRNVERLQHMFLTLKSVRHSSHRSDVSLSERVYQVSAMVMAMMDIEAKGLKYLHLEVSAMAMAMMDIEAKGLK